MKKIFYWLGTAGLVVFLETSGCNCKKKDCFNDLLFQVPFHITPQDTFRLGDTIWITAQMKDLMREMQTNQLLQTNNLNLSTDILLGKIYPDSILLVPNHFSMVPQTGMLQVRPSGAIKVSFDTTGTEQKLRFALIPKVLGGYLFAPNYSTNSIDKNLKLTNSDCIDLPSITYRTNDGVCNFNILKHSRLDTLKEADYIKHGAYGFEVIPR